MRKSRLSLLVLPVIALAFSSPAKTGDIAWGKVIGANLGKLNDSQKSSVKSLLNSIRNTRGCSGTLAQCLAQGDLTAARHAGYVARMVRKNKSQSFIKKGVQKRAASAFPEEQFQIKTSNNPYVGNPGAKVVLVEYACFECPYCAYLAPKLKKLHTRFKGKVVHYYKFFPVRSHRRGVATALAGLAAARQGKFWKMYDLMFANRHDLEDDDLLVYAKKAGLNIDKFKKDIKDASLMSDIERDKLEGMRFGVEGTPTFYINGKLYKGASDYAEIADRIAEELDILEGRIK